MAKITQVSGFESLDSRGNPTVAAEVVLADGAKGFGAAPSGASTGCREALGAKVNYVGHTAFSVLRNAKDQASGESIKSNGARRRVTPGG